jgi:hypothetical protein
MAEHPGTPCHAREREVGGLSQHGVHQNDWVLRYRAGAQVDEALDKTIEGFPVNMASGGVQSRYISGFSKSADCTHESTRRYRNGRKSSLLVLSSNGTRDF